MKKFLKIFFLVFILEAILVIVLMLAENFTTGILASIFHISIDLISMPSILIDRTYPFYTPDGAVIAISAYTVNILVHSGIIYSVIKNRKSKSAETF